MKRMLLVVLGQFVLMALVVMPLAAQNTTSPVEQVALLKDVENAIASFNALSSFSLSGRIQTSQGFVFQKDAADVVVTSVFMLQEIRSNIQYDANHQPNAQGDFVVRTARSYSTDPATTTMSTTAYQQNFVIVSDDIYVELVKYPDSPRGWIKNPNSDIAGDGLSITIDRYANFGIEYLKYSISPQTISEIELLPSKDLGSGKARIIKATFNASELFYSGELGFLEFVIQETGLDKATISTAFGQNSNLEVRYWIGEDNILHRIDIALHFNSNLEGVGDYAVTYPYVWDEQWLTASFTFDDFNQQFTIKAPI